MTDGFRYGNSADMETAKSLALKEYRVRTDQQLKELAAKLGIAPSVLHKWENKRVPADKCIHVESITGIPCHLLRPDVFKAPKRVRVAA